MVLVPGPGGRRDASPILGGSVSADLPLSGPDGSVRLAAEMNVAGAERAARRLIAHSPLRETDYRPLMDALAARGNVAEAIPVSETARTRLREELGIAPGPAIQEAHARLLGGQASLR
jgi:DNA-binding SARP family transcriptional activator